MAEWKTFDLSDVLPGAENLEELQTVVDALVAVGDVAVTVLEVLKAFLVALPNPVSASISLLLAEIQTILDNLRETGAFGLFLIPTTLEEVQAYKGGYPKFKQLFLQSLFDVEDPNRPQIGPDGHLGAFFLFVNKDSVADFLRQVMSLANLFRQPDLHVQYPPPINVTVEPADADGDTAGSIINLFEEDDDLTSLVFSWEEPKFSQSLFYDIFASNKFYLERSKSREGTLLTRDKTRKVQENPIQKKRKEDGQDSQIKEPVLNRLGEPIYVWEPAFPNDPFFKLGDDDVSQNFIAGSYSYVMRDVEKGIENGYYYRIRSVPSDTGLSYVTGPNGETVYTLVRNGKEWLGSQPSMPVFGHLPDVDTSFDMPTALLNVYRAAYLLRFDTDATDHSDSNLFIGSSSIEPGIPTRILDAEAEGAREPEFVTAYSDTLIQEDRGDINFEILEGGLFEDAAAIEDYATSRRYVSVVGSITSSDTLEKDPFAGARELFDGVFGMSPHQQFRIWVDKVALERVDEILPTLTQNESLYEMVKSFYEDAESSIVDLLTSDGFNTSKDLITDDTVRTKVHLLIQTVDKYVVLGQPPNWQSLRLFEDLIPEGDQLLDRLFRMMKSFENVFADINAAIENTIDGLRARLGILNDIVDFLDTIISFYASLDALDFSVSVLFIPPNVGGTPYLAREFMEAESPPDTSPDDFSAGVVLAFGGAGRGDVEASENAIRFIFGL